MLLNKSYLGRRLCRIIVEFEKIAPTGFDKVGVI